MLTNIKMSTKSSQPEPAQQERRRSSLLAVGRRSSIQLCESDTDEEMTDQEEQEQEEVEQVTRPPPRRAQRRRSSVTFSSTIVSDVQEVENHNTSQQESLFYSCEDIAEFREEARMERRMARRNSTGGLPPTMSAAYMSGLGTTTNSTSCGAASFYHSSVVDASYAGTSSCNAATTFKRDTTPSVLLPFGSNYSNSFGTRLAVHCPMDRRGSVA